MSAKFDPIRVINLITEKTEASPTASGLRLMYFQISAPPTSEWIQLFDNQRRIPTGRNMSGGCAASVEGRHIVLDCIPDEIEKQFENLKHDVAVANAEYQKHLDKVAALNSQEAQKHKAEIDKINSIKSRLKFD